MTPTSDFANDGDLVRLRQEIQVGLDQIKAGEVAEVDFEKIKEEGRRQLAARKLK